MKALVKKCITENFSFKVLKFEVLLCRFLLYCNKGIFSLTACELLRHVVLCCVARLVALYNSLTIIVTSFLCLKCIRIQHSSFHHWNDWKKAMMYKSTDHGSDVSILFHDGCCVCYILKYLKDKKLWSVYIYYTVLTSFSFSNCSASLRSSIHSLRIRMTSYPCNKYEQITPSYLLSVK